MANSVDSISTSALFCRLLLGLFLLLGSRGLAGQSNDVVTVEAPPMHRGTQYTKSFQETMKPIGRLITSLRLRLDRESEKTTIERMLRLQGARLNRTVVYAGVIDRFGQIKIASLPAHPDYGKKAIIRSDTSLQPMRAIMNMRHSKTDTWMVHRQKTPHHYELIVQPSLKGIYDQHLIYYCIDLEAICERAGVHAGLKDNEAYYLLSKEGALITQSPSGDTNDNRLTAAEMNYLETVQARFSTEHFGTHSHVGFARGSAELITQTFSWAKLVQSANDDWILVFEEKTPTPRYEQLQLFGTWKNKPGDAPLSLGILQEGSKLYFRAEGVAGVFRAEGRFIGDHIGVTSSYQDDETRFKVINFSATYDAEKDLISVSLVWEQDGKARTRSITMLRAKTANDLTPISVPLVFPSFPDMKSAAPAEE